MSFCVKKGPSSRGAVATATLMLVMVLALMVATAMIYARSSMIVSGAVDYLHETSVECKTFEQLVTNSILQKEEVTPNPSSATLNSIVDTMVGAVNAGSLNLVFARVGNAPALTTHRFYPDALRPAVAAQNIAGLIGVRYQLLGLIQNGVAAVGGPVNFTFSRTDTTNAALTRTITVSAQVWSVPMVNFAMQAYGLPASIPSSAGIEYSAPPNTSGIITSGNFSGGVPMLLTNLRPSPDYAPGDTTAYDQLYSPPLALQPERLPTYYRSLTSIGWNAWEYIWNSYVPLLPASATNLYDFTAFTPATITGVTVNSPTNITVNLATVPGGTLAIEDGFGGSTVTIQGAAASSTTLVVVIRNPTATPTTVNLAGNNARSVLVYFNTCNVSVAGAPSWNGALFFDPTSTATGTLSLTGSFAFLGANSANLFPGLSLSLTPASGSLLSDLQDISPRCLFVSTSSQLN